MAVTRSTFVFSLLISTSICLMAIKAKEQPRADIQSKQMYLMPHYYPASIQFYYPESKRYGNSHPLSNAVPSAEPFVDNSRMSVSPTVTKFWLPVSESKYSRVLLFSIFRTFRYEGDDGTADVRHVETEGRYGRRRKWSKKSLIRQATLNILPAATECLNSNFKVDGLGPCKRASQAEWGVINLKFSAAGQTAIVAITADSRKHTRVTLICNEIEGAKVFTQTGEIKTVTETPRTEVGYIQLVATSAAGTDIVRCFWTSHMHYVGMYY